MAYVESDDSCVTYGEPFSDNDDEDRNYRSISSAKHRALPSAYEQRVLNEKGRPMRFHGAFTGGFSAGFFNSVGSKEGFKPQTFHSSRKTRQRDSSQQHAQRPEDFMDEEDFGEFGIAPRRIRTTHQFDDAHLRDTLKLALGEQSIIPGASGLLKELIVPTRGTLAERLLRRMGWKELNSESIEDDELHTAEKPSVHGMNTFGATSNRSAVPTYATISFVAKTNTFGLGYSGLDPEIAMGRRNAESFDRPWDDFQSDRHPEESVTALLHRHQNLDRDIEFDPKSGLQRRGIRGQAFGVGALENEDEDIYTHDKLADYDWEIGDRASGDDEEEDDEEVEMEAARLGRWSSSSGRKPKNSGLSRKFDGWTAPSDYQSSKKRLSQSVTNVLDGFKPAEDATDATVHLVLNNVRLPPGYVPVFNPKSVGLPDLPSVDSSRVQKTKFVHDALSRTRILDDSTSNSVVDDLDPVHKLRLEAEAAGLPVPTLTKNSDSDRKTAENSVSNATPALLKPFKSDSDKQSRFEAYQVLIRRGFSHDEAYQRSSGHLNLIGTELERDANSFRAILRLNQPIPPNRPLTHDSEQSNTESTLSNRSDLTPLSNRLPLHKQQLVASLLATRFRSAGSMDISKELTEAEQKAIRARVESLDVMEPRDHAVATESYGALTRRRLRWHPDPLLCKRINVPNPYPDSTFVGCPDERRIHNPFRHRARLRGSKANSDQFSLFDILDVNRGMDQSLNTDQSAVDPYGDDDDNDDQNYDEQTRDDGDDNKCNNPSLLSSTNDQTFDPNDLSIVSDIGIDYLQSSRRPTGAALFEALFEAHENRKSLTSFEESQPVESSEVMQNKPSTGSNLSSSKEPRFVGPSIPDSIKTNVDLNTDHHPMDLFKSIFASDEELSPSDSDHDDDDDDEKTDPVNATQTQENSLVVTSQSDDFIHARSLFAHLFDPAGYKNEPLSTLSKITTNPQPVSHQKTTTNENNSLLDPDLLHGPCLPPDFDPGNMAQMQVSNTTATYPTSSLVRENREKFIENPARISRSEKRRKKSKKKDKKSKKHKKRPKKEPSSSSSSNSSDSD